MSRYTASSGMSRSPKRARQLAQLVGRLVAPAALVIAERPARRQRNPPRQLGVALEHRRAASAPRRRSRSAARRRSAKPHAVGILAGQVEFERGSRLSTNMPHAWPSCSASTNGIDVYRLFSDGGVPGGRIDVPEDLVRAGLVESARALATAEVPLGRRMPLVHAPPGPQRVDEPAGAGTSGAVPIPSAGSSAANGRPLVSVKCRRSGSSATWAVTRAVLIWTSPRCSRITIPSGDESWRASASDA